MVRKKSKRGKKRTVDEERCVMLVDAWTQTERPSPPPSPEPSPHVLRPPKHTDDRLSAIRKLFNSLYNQVYSPDFGRRCMSESHSPSPYSASIYKESDEEVEVEKTTFDDEEEEEMPFDEKAETEIGEKDSGESLDKKEKETQMQVMKKGEMVKWLRLTSHPTGEFYYYNRKTNKTRWILPDGETAASAECCCVRQPMRPPPSRHIRVNAFLNQIAFMIEPYLIPFFRRMTIKEYRDLIRKIYRHLEYTEESRADCIFEFTPTVRRRCHAYVNKVIGEKFPPL